LLKLVAVLNARKRHVDYKSVSVCARLLTADFRRTLFLYSSCQGSSTSSDQHGRVDRIGNVYSLQLFCADCRCFNGAEGER